MASINLKQLKALGKKIEQRIQKSEEALKKAPEYAYQINQNIARSKMPNEIVKDRFFKSASAGVPWKPLAPKTIKNRIAAGWAPGPPLIRSGALWRGATGGKATATLQRVVLPFKGRAEKYAFNSRVSGGRNFYAKPSRGELEKIITYRDREIINVIISLLNGRKPRIRKPAIS